MAERILVVDDDRDICRYIEVNLTLEGYEVYVEHDGESAVATAQRVQPDLVLLDVMMPGLDGFGVCERLRADPRTANAAVIMLTARAMPADKVLGLTAGADDYVAKPFDPPELVARVGAVLRRSRRMRDLSPLTGLPGNFQISEEIDRLVRSGRGFAVIYADLDNFKAYNDRYGFLRGDGAIKATARVITGVLARHAGEPRFVGHIGGDDFVVIVAPGEAEAVARDVIDAFDGMAPSLYDPEDRERGFIEVHDRRGNVLRFPVMTISMGIATTAHRRIGSQWEASSIAAEMKMVAKRSPGSSFEIDRRRG
ncbi:MAG: diguanylate cyclase response regulator [Acidimicrobiia bacterium]